MPGWQALYEELGPDLTVVTVALDTGGPDVARPFVESAKPTHPSLIDQAHVVDELFGIVNVPMGVWIDEEGMIVRPAEVAYVGRMDLSKMKVPEGLDPYLAAVLEEAKKIRVDRDAYVNALRAWVATGAHALTPEDVVARSRPRPPEAAEAAAHFELGQHLHRTGHADDAVEHFRRAHRLEPGNWTYKRQAWQFAHPFQGPTELYDGDWLSDVQKIGAENYYPPLDL